MNFLISPSPRALSFLKLCRRIAFGFLAGLLLSSTFLVFSYVQQQFQERDTMAQELGGSGELRP